MLSIERLIARQVWHSAFSNRAVVGLLVGIGLLLAYAVGTGWITVRQQNETGQHYQQQARQDWLSNPDKHPHRMAHYGHFAFRRSQPLSVFDFGMERYLGNTIYLEAHKQNAVNFSEAGFSTGLLRFGEISPAMVLQLLMPLLLFFLGFGLVATERESGTLKIILSQGVSWRQLLAGKFLGLLAVMSTLFGPVVLVTGVLWLVAQGGAVSTDQGARLLVLVVAYFIYLSLWCGLAVLVSARSRTAKTALVSLIGLWLVLTIVLPRASQALGSYLYPAPTKVAFLADIQADVLKEGDSHNASDPHFKGLKDSLLTAYNVASVEELPFNYGGFQMAEGERISATIYNQHTARLLTIYDRQNSFARAIAFIDPFMAIKNLSMALAGTDFATYADFQAQAEQYRYDMAQKMNELQMKYISARATGPTSGPNKLDHSHWEKVPDFSYQPPTIASVFQHEILSLLAFGFWVVVVVLVARRLTNTLTAL